MIHEFIIAKLILFDCAVACALHICIRGAAWAIVLEVAFQYTQDTTIWSP
jgi:hypothetical protein